MPDWYEVLERFAIVAESEGDIKALQVIRLRYGQQWVDWLSNYIYGGRK